ncbi:hypothetical protein GCM10010245_11360 [Streptomyces spectabilis]|nr:hypothetical protein GCM10010245_11360 [Streptomyces spectabilis]
MRRGPGGARGSKASQERENDGGTPDASAHDGPFPEPRCSRVFPGVTVDAP